MEETKVKKVAFYIRVSTEEQAQDDKYGEKNQLDALQALIRSKSATLGFAGDEYVYVDQVSGTIDIDDRPSFRKLKEDIIYAPADAKPFDIVAVYKIDRFARKLRVLLKTIDWLEESNLEFISVHESIDTSTPFGKAMLGIIGVISELEIENIKIRTHGGRAVAAKEGKYVGKIPPYGYIKDPAGKLIVCNSEAPTLKKIFDLFTKESYTTSQIATYLHENKIYSPESSAILNNKTRIKKSNKKYESSFWQERTVRRMLSEEIYLGDYYYNKSKTINKKQVDLPREEWKLSDYHHEALIGRFQFMQAKEILENSNRNNKNYGVNTDHVYLLTGLLKCAACFESHIDEVPQSWIGNKKEIKSGSGNYTYSYICRRKSTKKSTIHCHALPLPAKEMEEYVVNFITELLNNPVDTFNYYKDMESSKAQKKQLEQKIKELDKIIGSYDNTREILREQNKRGIISMDKLEKDIDELNQHHKNNIKERENAIVQLTPLIVSEGYEEVFKIFKEYYAKRLDEIVKSRQKTQDLLRLIIKDIVVASRPVTQKDIIAGKKTNDQEIPHKLLIKLRLPKDILMSYVREANSQATDLGDVREIWSPSSGQSEINGARGQT